ncbi:MAG: carbonic anhydrase [Hyphomicrobiaceae bacterium]
MQVDFPHHVADRFNRFRFRHFAPNHEHYQHPEVMVVSCRDSRVDPETIFSAMPGELFVVATERILPISFCARAAAFIQFRAMTMTCPQG